MRARASLESYFTAVLSSHVSPSGVVMDTDALRRAALLEVTRWLRGEAAFYSQNGHRDAAVIIRQLAHTIFDT